MKFSLEIDLGNDAMQTGHDLYTALCETARNNFRNNGEEIASRDSGFIMDGNGNRVGQWKLAAL